MDHDATREELELAAAEPGGLERLMAGDTATAQAVAAHLAGCETCSEELARLQRSAPLIRSAVRELPPDDLRARTLAAVRTQGVPRPLAVAAAGSAVADPGSGAADATAGAGTGNDSASAAPGVRVMPRRGWRIRPALGLVATVAAAVVLSVLATTLIIDSRVDGRLAAQSETIADLQHVTSSTLAVTAQPDAEHVALTGVADPAANGNLVFSPSSAELVVTATGLKTPPAGYEYRCWVSIDGSRQRVGKMFFGEGLAYWVGSAPAVSGLSSRATFGVSLVGVSGATIDTNPVLLGQL
jgi:anti-sigma factor RsiW